MSTNKNRPQIPNQETYSRMNFLYQASMLMAKKNVALSSYYGEQCRSIGKKAQLRISPDLKRDLCKRCGLAQRPGITTDLEIRQPKKRRRKKIKNQEPECVDDDAHVVMKCKLCTYSRSFRVNPDYKFWLENPSSVAEEIVYHEDKPEKAENVSNVNKEMKES